MIVSSAFADVRTVSLYSRCSGESGVSSSSPVMPMTPFIGVRISWLMLARNTALGLRGVLGLPLGARRARAGWR